MVQKSGYISSWLVGSSSHYFPCFFSGHFRWWIPPDFLQKVGCYILCWTLCLLGDFVGWKLCTWKPIRFFHRVSGTLGWRPRVPMHLKKHYLPSASVAWGQGLGEANKFGLNKSLFWSFLDENPEGHEWLTVNLKGHVVAYMDYHTYIYIHRIFNIAIWNHITRLPIHRNSTLSIKSIVSIVIVLLPRNRKPHISVPLSCEPTLQNMICIQWQICAL